MVHSAFKLIRFVTWHVSRPNLEGGTSSPRRFKFCGFLPHYKTIFGNDAWNQLTPLHMIFSVTYYLELHDAIILRY